MFIYLLRTSCTGSQISIKKEIKGPVRPSIEGIAFPPPKQRFGTVWEKPIICFGAPNRCFGGRKAMP